MRGHRAGRRGGRGCQAGRQGGRGGRDAGPGDEVDGTPGRGRGGRDAGTGAGRTGRRDGRALGISTYFRDFRLLGRDLQPAATAISTFSAVFRYLGRDLQTAASGISTLFDRFPLFG